MVNSKLSEVPCMVQEIPDITPVDLLCGTGAKMANLELLCTAYYDYTSCHQSLIQPSQARTQTQTLGTNTTILEKWGHRHEKGEGQGKYWTLHKCVSAYYQLLLI